MYIVTLHFFLSNLYSLRARGVAFGRRNVLQAGKGRGFDSRRRKSKY